MTSQWHIPRETEEWIGPVTVTPADKPLELAILPAGERPTADDWEAPLVIDGKPGLMFTPPGPGAYLYWARVTGTPEKPVVEAFATIRVS